MWAFIGAKRRPLTEQVGGLGAVFRREGQHVFPASLRLGVDKKVGVGYEIQL